MTSPASDAYTSALEIFKTQQDFPLDGFQEQAMATLENGHSVVVCAPTGSGKTLIAEFGILLALQKGVKVFYTTPLKALSNQKFFDFKQRYGEPMVGLLTGDLSINRTAPIVVMTTEIFRNMLYGIHEDSSLLNDIGFVVLDECHFMNDAQRGTVWEESIIYCPEHIQVVALSATVANAQELTSWIDHIHGDTRLIETDFRPVPLRFSYFKQGRIFPLFESNAGKGRTKLNKQLQHSHKGDRVPKHQRKPAQEGYVKLIEEMHQRNMLPAIVFIFSRKGCDTALEMCQRIDLTTPAERERLQVEIADFVAQYPMLENHPKLEGLYHGVAVHHAGLLPALKLLVEQLFQCGLIKVVFATETLAAGINMPARSTVITTISKRTDSGHRLLNASEFLQMSGRAGRRGMDDKGYVVVCDTQYQSAGEVAKLASSGSDPLNSQFTPTYGMVLNLLQRHTMQEAEFLIQKSFGQFTAQRRLMPLTEELGAKQEKLQGYEAFQCPAELTDKAFEIYLNDKERLHELNRQYGMLKKQMKRFGPEPDMIEELNRLQSRRQGLHQKQQETPCDTCPEFRYHLQLTEKQERVSKQVKQLQWQLEHEQHMYWNQFMNIYALLKDKEYLDEYDKPSRSGMLMAKLRTENEMFLAKLVLEGYLEGLSPEQLASVIAAVVNDSNRDLPVTSLNPSPQVQAALHPIIKCAVRLRNRQRRYRIDIPVTVNTMVSPLVEVWGEGYSWLRLSQSTTLGEGDLVRLIRRTADVLRQLSRIEEVPLGLSETARIALERIYRDPVKEVELPELSSLNEYDEDPLPAKTENTTE